MRLLIAILLVATGSAAMASAPVAAAELLMIERDGCDWCDRWRREIGKAYPQTPEGRIAPLKTVDLGDPWPSDLEYVSPDIMTPTFVLIHEGRDYGRIRGYPGEIFFWTRLASLIVKLPAEATVGFSSPFSQP